MRGLVLLCLVIAGCEKASAPAAGSGDPALDQFMADFVAYGDKSVVILAKFDGNCAATADQMLTLEPLAQRLRSAGNTIGEAKIKGRAAGLKDTVMKHYEELLRPLGLTIADLDKKEAEMKAKCGSDPKWQDAQERTGLMKKKRP